MSVEVVPDAVPAATVDLAAASALGVPMVHPAASTDDQM